MLVLFHILSVSQSLHDFILEKNVRLYLKGKKGFVSIMLLYFVYDVFTVQISNHCV